MQRHDQRLQLGRFAYEGVSEYIKVSFLNFMNVMIKNCLTNHRVVRYEDMSISSYNMTQEILQFYGLPFDQKVIRFLDTHTKTNVGGVSSTIRDSKSAPFHWTKELTYDEVKNIQKNCKEAMRLWGFKEAKSSDELLNDFNPLLKFSNFDTN